MGSWMRISRASLILGESGFGDADGFGRIQGQCFFILFYSYFLRVGFVSENNQPTTTKNLFYQMRLSPFSVLPNFVQHDSKE